MSALLQREWELEDEAKARRALDPLSHEGDVAGTIEYIRELDRQIAQARELASKALVGRWVRFRMGKYAGYVGEIEWVSIGGTDGHVEFLAQPRSLRNPFVKLWGPVDTRRYWQLGEVELLPRTFTGEDTSRKPVSRRCI